MLICRVIYFPMLLILAFCSGPDDSISQISPIDDAYITLQSSIVKRDYKGVIPYTKAASPEKRKQAAIGLGNIGDTLALEQLNELLQDPNPGVRAASADALGLLGDATGAEYLIRQWYTEEVPTVRKSLLKALGKCITSRDYNFFYSINPEDSLELEGLVWGIYNAGIRGLHDGVIMEKIAGYFHSEQPHEVRLGIAQFFAQSRNMELISLQRLLVTAASKEPSPQVRMAIVKALAKINSPTIGAVLANIAKADADERVKILALQGIRPDALNNPGSIGLELIQSKHSAVRVAAAEFLFKTGFNEDATLIDLLNHETHHGVKAGILKIMAANSPQFQSEILDAIPNADDPYIKAQYIKSLPLEKPLIDQIKTYTGEEHHPVVRTTSYEKIMAILRKDPNHSLLMDWVVMGLESKDGGMVYLAADEVRRIPSEDINENKLLNTAIEKAWDQLNIPEDMDAMVSLLALEEKGFSPPTTIAVMKPNLLIPDFNRLATMQRHVRYSVRTSAGSFIIRLYPRDAPATVSYFDALVKDGYFHAKVFHRVVPGFVAQTGCSRGDGFGSGPVVLPSELSNKTFREGSIGMASAGKDTESTQWFITLGAAPHLEGRYTRFGQVEEGMAVVLNISVGDIIENIERLEGESL